MNLQVDTLMSPSVPQESGVRLVGTHDGSGAGDCDKPYRFGRRPNTSAPFPFTERQYARLLIFRGRFRDGTEYAERANTTRAFDAEWHPAAA